MTPHLVKASPGTPEFDATWRLRAAILLDPFGIDHGLARIDDAQALHLGLFVDGACLACLMLVPRGENTLQMRQVAVAVDQQRQGLGRRLVEEAEQLARTEGFRRIIAHARDTAVPFYLALGYQPVSDVFNQVGLTHRTVAKVLSTPANAPSPG